jgi:hypothetical protein
MEAPPITLIRAQGLSRSPQNEDIAEASQDEAVA